MLDQKKRTLKRLGIAGVATAMTTMGIPGIAGAATLRVAPDAVANATATPSAPTALKATDVGAGKVMLSWTAPSGTVSGYNVYVGTASGGEATTPANGDVLVHGTTYTVTDSVPGTALTAGGTYYFTVAAVNAAGQGSLSVEANATASAVAPSAPGSVTATPSAVGATVSWKAPTTGDTPTYYTVNYGTSSTALDQSVSVQATSSAAPPTTTYIGGLTQGTTYYFHVTATNAAGTSTASSTVSATPNTGLVPPAPTDVGATGGNGSITVNWTEPNPNSNSVTGYNVYAGTSSGGESSTPVNGSVPITGSGTTFSTTVPVTAGTTEYFTVKAINSVGMSPASEEASATASVTTQAAPTAPQFLSATALNSAVRLKWQAPASSGDSAIVSYNVYEDGVTSPVTTSSGTSTLVTGLTDGTTYTFEVAAVNASESHTSPNGQGKLSEGASAKPLASIASAPTAPGGFSASTKPNSDVNTLTWSTPSYRGAADTAKISDYLVYRNGVQIATVPGTSTTSSAVKYTFTDSGKAASALSTDTVPVPGTTYKYTVAAVSSSNQTSPTAGPIAVDTGNATPGAPGLGTPTVPTNGTVSLSWTAPAETGVTGGTLKYVVLENGQQVGSATTATTMKLTGLSTTTANTFAVEAESFASAAATAPSGTSGESNIESITANATPPAPSGLSATVEGPSAVKLVWNQPTGTGAAPGNYVILESTSSKVNTSTGELSSPTTVAEIDTSTSFTVTTGLTAGTTEYFQVEALNSTDGHSFSNVPSATPKTTSSVTAAPGAPTALAATVEGGLVNLSWTTPSSAGSAPITKYEVWEAGTTFGSKAASIGMTSGTGTSAVVDGLTPGETVDLYVKAVNSIGTSALSAPVEVTPSSSNVKPSAPGRPIATSEGAGRALVVWTAPSTFGSSAIHGYFVTAHLVGGKGKTIFVSGTTTSATVGGLMEGGTYYFTVVAVNAVGGGTPSAPSTFIKVSGVATKVYVTPPAMLNGPGTAMIRVTVNSPTARVQLFDEANGKNFFFSKAIKETTPSKYGNGVAEFLVNIDATNSFYVMVNGVKSNVVTAMVK